MRGAVGNFFDKLLERIKKRRKRKLIIKKETDLEFEKKKIKKDIKRKKQEEINNYFCRKNQKLKKKVKNNKIKLISPKGISKIKPIKKLSNPKKVLNVENAVLNKKHNKYTIPKKKGIQNSEKNIINSISKPIKKTQNKDVNKLKKKRIIKTRKLSKGIDIKQVDSINSKTNILKNDLVNEINKVIKINKSLLQNIIVQLKDLDEELKTAKTKEEVDKIEIKLFELKKQLQYLIDEFYKFKDKDIHLFNEVIQNKISEIKNIDSTFDIEQIMEKLSINLDYYNDLINSNINASNMIENAEDKKIVINDRQILLYDEKKRLEHINAINKRLSIQIDKNKQLLKDFDELIQNITPKEIVKVQSQFLSNLVKKIKGIFGTFFSIPFLKKSKDIPMFTVGLYGVNSSIRSARAIVNKKTTIKFVPTADFSSKLLDYKNKFVLAEYMLDDTLSQIKFLREEFVTNFGNYFDYNEFYSQLSEIDNIEKKLNVQKQNIQKVKQKYNVTIEKNNQKVELIKKM